MNKKNSIDIKKLIITVTVVLMIIAIIKYYKQMGKDLSHNLIPVNEEIPSNKPNIKIKSGNLTTDYSVDKTLADINKFGLNTINIPIVINIDSLSSDNMSIDAYSEEKAISLIKKLDRKKVDIILEPYPWIANGSLTETEWKPTNINNFFYNWKAKVLSNLINDIANPYSVKAIVIASNFAEMEYATGYWCDTIDYVRKSYKGLVTYRTNWWSTAIGDDISQKAYENKLNNDLFSKVDFISIAAYFQLTNSTTNSVETLTNSIYSTEYLIGTIKRKQNIKQELENFYLKWNKPIFFGELGFPPKDGASINPCESYPTHIDNNLEQANCFNAYRNVFERETWLMGFSIFAIGNSGEENHYYPGDEATEIIKKWYN
ncbi:MAG: hydrolase [Clostridiaceae bacterium]|nr:hydrolase [Clostridiaceae bacterium]